MNTHGVSNEDVRTPLYRVPRPMLLEAPSSWLSRIALMQGERLRDVLRFLQLDHDDCLDAQFCIRSSQVGKALGGMPERMLVSCRIYLNALKLQSERNGLIVGDDKVGRFRFCPECLASQHEPHVPIHWRLKPWRYCHEHRRVLSEVCPHCKLAPRLPVDLVASSRWGKRAANLSRCRYCGESLAKAVADDRDLDCPQEEPYDSIDIDDGRAMVAALYYGRWGLRGYKAKLELRHLRTYISLQYQFGQ